MNECNAMQTRPARSAPPHDELRKALQRNFPLACAVRAVAGSPRLCTGAGGPADSFVQAASNTHTLGKNAN